MGAILDRAHSVLVGNPSPAACSDTPPQRKSAGYRIAKRAFDIGASAVGCAISLPIVLVAGAVIVIDDPSAGPLFIQERLGKDGKPFKMLKLRTMHGGASEEQPSVQHLNAMDGPAFKMQDDPRITRVGGFLRRSHIDELPQFANVLAGDMSIVGPRPPLPREVARYDERQRQRLSVAQGLTCYWQIAPDRYTMPFDRWVDLDLRYIEEQGVSTDLKIILATIATLLRCDGW